MEPNVDESPVHFGFLKPGLVVFDCVYTPENTLLLNAARKRSCNVITGVELFVRQAALQFRLFTGVEPSLDYMRDLVRKGLSHLRPREVP
jgi:3-dehydroquinate dehydratase/shikimate dehydrogenase